MSFKLLHESSEPGVGARRGVLTLPHGETETPVFMPVGTQGTVKAITPEELAVIGYRLILGNTYHLHLRPGDALIARAGGLHRFAGWDGALLTDSGGFQVFSLAGLRRIGDDGVRFQSHIDGSPHIFTAETVMEIERNLGADIIMAFDECAPYPSTHEYAHEAMERTHAWLERCTAAYNTAGRVATGGWPQALFGIVQGSTFEDLRRKSARFVAAQNLPGCAIGGLAVGEDPAQRNDTISWCTEELPRDRPRYLMGVGTPLDILDAVERGVDMFDCVLPTRNARNAQIFTSEGTLNLRNARFGEDFGPLDERCGCGVCGRHSRAYVRHLFKAKEILGPRLTTYHNLHFYAALMRGIREAITAGEFRTYSRAFRDRYTAGGETLDGQDE